MTKLFWILEVVLIITAIVLCVVVAREHSTKFLGLQ